MWQRLYPFESVKNLGLKIDNLTWQYHVKGHLHYKTITSQIVICQTQVKNVFVP